MYRIYMYAKPILTKDVKHQQQHSVLSKGVCAPPATPKSHDGKTKDDYFHVSKSLSTPLSASPVPSGTTASPAETAKQSNGVDQGSGDNKQSSAASNSSKSGKSDFDSSSKVDLSLSTSDVARELRIGYLKSVSDYIVGSDWKRSYSSYAIVSPATLSGAVTNYQPYDFCNTITLGTGYSQRLGNRIFVDKLIVKILQTIRVQDLVPVANSEFIPACYITIYRDKIPATPGTQRNVYSTGAGTTYPTSTTSLFDCQGRAPTINNWGYSLAVRNPNTIGECEIYAHERFGMEDNADAQFAADNSPSVLLPMSRTKIRTFEIPIRRYVQYADPASGNVNLNSLAMDLRWDITYTSTQSYELLFGVQAEVLFRDDPDAV